MRLISNLRSRLTYANVGVTVAMLLAMSGGAYAATKYVITSTKQIKPSVLKQLVGKTGPQGPAGKDGAPGANGKDGAPGLNGKEGPQGAQGNPGADGKAGPTGLEGKVGATGKAGATGPEGKPGSTGPEGASWLGKALPSGKTLTGDWSLIRNAGAFNLVSTSVSFLVPLEKAPKAHIIWSNGKEPFYNSEKEIVEELVSTSCTGTVGSPTAIPGSLCIYLSSEEGAPHVVFGNGIIPLVCAYSTGGACLATSTGNADKYGFGLEAFAEEAALVNYAGTWAVTAE